MSDFPTPPLPLTTAITFLMDERACGAFKKLSVFLEAQSEEQLEQSCVQFSDIIFSFFKILSLYTFVKDLSTQTPFLKP